MARSVPRWQYEGGVAGIFHIGSIVFQATGEFSFELLSMERGTLSTTNWNYSHLA